MNQPINHSTPESEERLEAWLARQPLTPAPDFVARTLERIRSEANLVTAAKAGDESAVDALLDRWLAEQPLEPDFEPAQLATQTRHTATREEREESREKEPMWPHTIIFPAWARAAVVFAAAASVALFAYLGTLSPGGSVTPMAGATLNAHVPDLSDDSSPSADYAWVSDPDKLAGLNDSLNNGAALLDSNNVALLIDEEPNSDEAPN